MRPVVIGILNQNIMLRQIITFGLLVFTLTMNAQTKSTNEIIAEGRSKIKVMPDMVTFTLTIEKKDTVEKAAIFLLNKEIDNLSKTLEKLGFNNKNVKISDLEISKNQRDDEIKKYTVRNVLKVNFGIDNKLIDELYKKIQENNISDLDISFETKVSDSLEKANRTKLVQLAVEDAKQNANNIATALNIKLGSVRQVIKSSENSFEQSQKKEILKFTAPKIVEDSEIKYKTSFDKYQLEELEFDEKITIIFEIKR